MDGLVRGILDMGETGGLFVSISAAQGKEHVLDYAASVTGPVLQEQEGDAVRLRLGAEIFQLWVVDRRGFVRYQHDSVLLPDDANQLATEIYTLLQEP